MNDTQQAKEEIEEIYQEAHTELLEIRAQQKKEIDDYVEQFKQEEIDRIKSELTS